jgi:hypothetical protein
MAQTWGESHHLPFYIILYDMPRWLHSNCVFFKTPKLKVPQFLKLGLLSFWMPIISCANIRLKWGLKQSYNLHWKLSNDMWHVASFTHIIQGNSQSLMVGSQIDILTPSPSFGHNLCCKYSNESCKAILDIYVLKKIQWYKEIFNAMNFNPLNRFLKIQKSI